MKIVLLFLTFLISFSTRAQLQSTVEVSAELQGAISEGDARRILLHHAALKSIEKFAPEMGYKYADFDTKLKAKFAQSFEAYQERKLVEKFGAAYKQTLSDTDKAAYLDTLESDRQEAFIKFSRGLECVRSHAFTSLTRDETNASRWMAKVNLDMDKVKLDGLLRKFIFDQKKHFSKILLLTEIEPVGFSWPDLGLESAASFMRPLNTSWLKWYQENLPSTVEEAVVCEGSCLDFYSKWIETHVEQVVLPEEYQQSVLLKINFQLKRSDLKLNLDEASFEWEGSAILLELQTKRLLASSTLGAEKRVFRGQNQKVMNSSLASSLYRSPLSSLLQFNHKLEEKKGVSRASKLVIKGHPHLGDVLLLMELLKVRGSSLGLEVSLDAFTSQEAYLNCFYFGEEKSFSDLLSGIKELKSSHSYSLVNEFTGVHYVIKFVTE